jgi:hypothetical protein
MLNVALFLKDSKRDLIKPATELGSKKVTLAAHYFPYAIEIFSKYKEIHGDLVIPTKYIVPEDEFNNDWPEWSHGCKLGMFAKRIRQRYHNNALADHLVQALEELDFVWDLNMYNRKIALLAYQRYKTIYGNLDIPATFVVPNDPEWPRETWGKKLGALTINLRYHPEEYNAIKPIVEEMGLSIQRGPQPHSDEHSSSTPHKRSGRGTSVDKFEDLRQTLLTFKDMYGNLDVPYNFPIDENDERFPARYRGCNLGRIANNIRYNNQYKAYREELTAIGFPFVSSASANAGYDEDEEEEDVEIIEGEEIQKEVEIVAIPKNASSSTTVANAAAAAVMASLDDSDSEASQDGYGGTSAVAAAVAAAASLTALSKSSRSLANAVIENTPAKGVKGKRGRASKGSAEHSTPRANIESISTVASSIIPVEVAPEESVTVNAENNSGHEGEEMEVAPMAPSIDYSALDESALPNLSKREYNKLKKFLALKEALLVYKSIYGHLSVPYHYAIPYDDERYTIEFRGKALGSIVNNIIYNRQYKEFEQELLSIGFTYEKPAKPIVQPLPVSAVATASSSSSASLALKTSVLESMIAMQEASSPRLVGTPSTASKRGRRSQYDLTKEALQIFVGIHGHANISVDYVIPEDEEHYPANLLGKPLGKWVQKIRKQAKKFSEQQKQELMELGLVFPYAHGNGVWLGEDEEEEEAENAHEMAAPVDHGGDEEQGQDTTVGAVSNQETSDDNINTVAVESPVVVGNKPLKKRGRKRKSEATEAEAEAE